MNARGEEVRGRPSIDPAAAHAILKCFSAPAEGDAYFTEPVREQRLNLLLHLAPISELVLVAGYSGSGKTTLIQRFVTLAGDRWHIFSLDLNSLTDDTDFLGMLAARFGITTAGDSGVSDQDALAQQFSRLSEGDNPIIVLVDNAHFLSGAALNTLAELFGMANRANYSLHVVLIGEPELAEQLEVREFADLHRRLVHTVDLPALNEAQTIQYIYHRLHAGQISVSGYLDSGMVKNIYKASNGYPGRINEAVKQFVTSGQLPLEKGKLARTRMARPLLSRINWSKQALPLLLILVFFGIMIGLRMEMTGETLSGQAQADKLVPDRPAPALQVAADEIGPVVPKNKADFPKNRPDEPSPDISGHSSDAKPAAPDIGLHVAADQERLAVTDQSALPVATPREENTQHAAKEIPEKIISLHESQKVGQGVATQVSRKNTEAAQINPPKQRVPHHHKTVTDDAGNIAWVLRQDPGTYTLQLLGSHNLGAVKKFIKARSVNGEARYISLTNKEKKWFVVLYRPARCNQERSAEPALGTQWANPLAAA